MKNNSILNILLISLLLFTKGNAQEKYSEELLIGKGNPVLFGDGIGLQKEAYDAFLKMKTAAQKDGINLRVVSGYRNFARQKAIYERKYKSNINSGLTPENAISKIIEYSTIPGTSRHHWGTDIDIIDGNKKVNGDVLDPDKFHGIGPFCKLKEWLDKNANTYGFYIVYTDNPNRKGFKYEPWHYSYKAISKPMLEAYQNLDIIAILKSDNLLGSEYLSESFMNNYLKNNVMDINPALK
ncbi:D-alanyl-D-alanine carboxypeptidase [Galbibacter orientalis DSM 19592]|uniref:D-alanyl-D-alanine carboxypeptidase n=1 Tax=Galbibacter orientalis DSM 19592 TaxID=926559 RepID=I3C5K7_9FLAO|nr:M15 family metallopeptidase [Galbibacter orientalis]EIJ38900.1 D-alanyl-D-alanine carboxypeptidase [Galbibacter orientalis DSM 19592]